VRPSATIVVPAVHGTASLAAWIDALAPGIASGVEILIVDRSGTAPGRLESLTGVRVIPVAATTALPVMRARGLSESTGVRVAVLGEHLRPGQGWLEAALRADIRGRVLAGPIDAGRLVHAAEWAFFLLEYARFTPPGGGGALPGTNCVYDRSLLETLGVLDEAEVWDAELHERLRGAGATMHDEPALFARCEKRLDALHLLAQRYHCARVSVHQRTRRWPLWKRWGFAAGTPLLPPLLLWRLLRVLHRKRRYRVRFLRTLPWLLAAAVAGAWGEAVGALAGPGRSAEHAE
jgi:hypothetical protein